MKALKIPTYKPREPLKDPAKAVRSIGVASTLRKPRPKTTRRQTTRKFR